MSSSHGATTLDPKVHAFYGCTMRVLRASALPFMLGGAYAFAQYTGIVRHTKDLDVFVRPQDAEDALRVLADAGYRTELTFPHWLGKAYEDDMFVDVIYGAGNGIAMVDDEWLEHAVSGEVLGVAVSLAPPEEMIWSKAFIMERERFDGADVAHLIRARGSSMDWARVVRRFSGNWRVLLSHLLLFQYIYPSERAQVPGSVIRELMARLEDDLSGKPLAEKLCRGTILSREQYLPDVTEWGYEDGRLNPRGNMTADDIAAWTAAIATDRHQ